MEPSTETFESNDELSVSPNHAVDSGFNTIETINANGDPYESSEELEGEDWSTENDTSDDSEDGSDPESESDKDSDCPDEFSDVENCENVVNMPFEIWNSARAGELLRHKHIIYFGDSIQRCAYKDLVTFLVTNDMSKDEDFKKCTEESHQTDQQVVVSEEKTNSFGFYQVRTFFNEETNTRVEFYFHTRLFSEYMVSVFEKDFADKKPDLIIVGCLFYDISKHHYNDNAQEEFARNLTRFQHLTKKHKVPILWREATPLGELAYGGFLILKKGEQDTNGKVVKLRQDIPIVNEYACKFWEDSGMEVLRVYNYFQTFVEEREVDDIHWKPFAHRILTFMILTKIRRMWGTPRVPWGFDPTMAENGSTKNRLEYLIDNRTEIVDLDAEPVFESCEILLENVKSMKNNMERDETAPTPVPKEDEDESSESDDEEKTDRLIDLLYGEETNPTDKEEEAGVKGRYELRTQLATVPDTKND